MTDPGPEPDLSKERSQPRPVRRPRPRLRLRRWLVPALLIVPLLVVLWLAGSEAGLRFGIDLARGVLPPELEIDGVSGRLMGPLRAGRLIYSSDDLVIQARSIELDWGLSELLWSDDVTVHRLKVGELHLELVGEERSRVEPAGFALGDAVAQPAPLALPINLELVELAIDRIVLAGVDGDQLIGSLRAAGRWRDAEVTLDALDLSGGPVALSVQGRADTGGAFDIELTGRYQIDVPGRAPAVGELAINGSWSELTATTTLASPYGAALQATLSDLERAPHLDAVLQLHVANARAVDTALPVVAARAEVVAQGALNALAWTLSADLDGSAADGWPTLTAQGSGQLTPALLHVDQLLLALEGQPSTVVIDGRLRWREAPIVALTAAWEALSIPLPQADVEVDAGALNLEGSLAAWRLSAATAASVNGRTAPLRLSANGDAQSLTLSELDLSLGNANLRGSGGLQWGSGGDATRASLELVGRGLDPSLFWPQYPGSLGGRALLSAISDDDGLGLMISSAKLNGRVRDLPVTLDLSGAAIDGDALTLSSAAVSIAGNQASLAGNWGRTSDLTLAVDAPDLASLASLLGSEGTGELTARARLSGLRDALTVSADVQGRGLRLSGLVEVPAVSAGRLELSLTAGLEPTSPLALSLAAAELVVDQASLGALSADASGSLQAHEVDLRADQLDLSAPVTGDEIAEASLSLTGGYDGSTWRFDQAKLTAELQASNDDQAMQSIASLAPFAGSVSQSSVGLDRLCLRADAKAGPVVERLCLSGDVQPGGSGGRIELNALHPGRLRPWLPAGVRVGGVVSGQASWRSALSDLTIDLGWTQPTVSLLEDDGWSEPMTFDDSLLTLRPAAEQLLLSLSLPGEQQQATVDAAFTPTPGLRIADWPLAAEVAVRLPDLSFVSGLSPLLVSVSGEARLDAELAGSLARPQLQLEASATAPRVQLTDPALTLTQSVVQLSSNGDAIDVSASSVSGDGRLELSGSVDLAARRFVGALSGERFRVSDSAEARIDVSPQINLEIADQAVTLSGQVGVPRADIVLQQLPEGAVVVSSDQVIVGNTSGRSEAVLAVTADLDVRLGDQVTFAGLGLDARFTGGLKIQQRPGRATSAIGEIEVARGSYQAYGQDLTVERGRLIYAGGEIDNPGLDVRAVRQATTEVTVGVDVRGTLIDPQLSVFSQPPLPSSDQIAYLVLGRPLSGSSSSEQSALRQAALALGVRGGKLVTDRLGERLAVDTIDIQSAPGAGNDQAALVIGKYLTPELYVSYGYGLFEPISTLRLEYQLNRLWRLVTESSNEATGGDIEWVMEK